MGDAGQNNFVDVAEDRVEGLALAGAARGQLRTNLARLDLGQHRVLLDVLLIVGDPLDQQVAPAAKFVGVHRVVAGDIWGGSLGRPSGPGVEKTTVRQEPRAP